MKLNFALFLVILVLFTMGIFMVFNTTSAETLFQTEGAVSHMAMLRQLIFLSVGTAFSAFIYFSGYEKMLQRSHGYLLGLTILLLLVFVPKVGMQINGAYRWINFFGVSLQPSEFVKVILPLFYLRLYFREGSKLTFWRFCLWQVPLLFPVVCILLEPDNGTAAILLATLVMLFFLSRVRWLYWIIPMMIVAAATVSVALTMTHVNERIRVYLDPESDILGKGHQPYQAKIAAGSGGLFGRGFGESMQKYHYLPEARSDYIAAIYAEEFGFIGIVFLMTLYMAISLIGFAIASKAETDEGYLTAAIYTFVITFQAFLNLGVVSGLLPSKGTNLPFFSQGGSSLVANCFMIAVLMNIHAKRREVCRSTS